MEPISVSTREVLGTRIATFGLLSPIHALAMQLSGLSLEEMPWMTDCGTMDLD